MNPDLSEKIDLFFQDPKVHHPAPSTSKQYGILHLLRRDIIRCSGKDPETGQESKIIALWPQTMAVLAGIDLLAKFYEGSDSNAIGKRFARFVKDNFDISSEKAETIWQLRNSLLHSFGLFSKDNKGKIYKFKVTNEGGELVSNIGSNQYRIDLLTLNSMFEKAVDKYKKRLLEDACLQKNFQSMFENYGSIYIGPP
jgi:hypothetical protein